MGRREATVKRYPTLGVCGLDCGLCPRYYTRGASRCPGCAGAGFFDKHPSCSFITCCVKKKGLEVCGECAEFPCGKFKSEAEYRQVKESSSYPSYKAVMPNLKFVKAHGTREFIARQRKRIKWLEKAIAEFDEGRSRSFLCKAACLLDVTVLEGALREARRQARQAEAKARAKTLRGILGPAGEQRD